MQQQNLVDLIKQLLQTSGCFPSLVDSVIFTRTFDFKYLCDAVK